MVNSLSWTVEFQRFDVGISHVSNQKDIKTLGCLGYMSGMKSYPVMWGLFDKPLWQDPY